LNDPDGAARQAASSEVIGGESPLRIEEYEGHRVLVADGVILSVAVTDTDPPFGYWTAMLPEGAPRTALLLGLGAGTLAHLLARRFDYVAVDLFCGHAFQRGALARPFLRQLKTLAGPTGEIAVNFFKDRRSEVYVGRLARVLTIRQVERLVRNVVVHCRAGML
jgi:hypothetical protein